MSSWLRRTSVLLGMLAVLAACGDSPKVTLTGTVKDAYTNQPIEGAQVFIGQRTGLPTDAQGGWKTQDWAAKDQLIVQATGYQSATLPLAERSDLVKPQSLTATLELVLRPNVLRGSVKDAYSDQPVSGAIVEVVNSTPLISATTNAQGAYELNAVPEAFQVVVRLPGHEEQRADVRRTIEQDLTVRPNELTGLIKDTYSDQPVADVVVKLGEAEVKTDAQGRYKLVNVPAAGKLTATRDGYDDILQPFTKTTTLDLTLRPNVITGIVTDATSGKVLSDTFVMASTTYSNTAVTSTRSDKDGRFVLKNVPEGAYLKALLPGYRRGEAQVTAGGLKDGFKLEPMVAKALYIKSIVAAKKQNVIDYFDIVDKTELNAVVLDLKSDNLEDLGLIYYDSQVPLIKELGTSADVLDLPWILAEAKKRNIYMIARIHIFSHDNELIKVRPDWYVQKNGKPYFADFGVAWLDTYDERVWDYNIALAVEASQMGFDEINFDYIRFPSDGDLTDAVFKGPRDWRNNPDDMYNTVGRFLERGHKAVNEAGAYLGGDVFGYVAWKPQANIGQNLQIMGKHLDYVYPMVYPSHFLFNEMGFENAGAHPYEIVAESMRLVKNQMTGAAARAKVRPWLQDFTLIWLPDKYIVRYGAKEVRAQIDAAEDNDVNGWALWDSDNDYTVDALKP